jgi:integrase
VSKIRLREPDKWIEHLKPRGRQIDFQDRLIPNLHLRLLPSGVKTFVLTTRYPGYRNPTRRALGRFGVLTLDTARAKAREWIALIEKGIDPEQHEAELRVQNQLKNAESFAAVATRFKQEYAPKIAKTAECEAAVDEMIARWGPRPFTAIMPHEVSAWIGEVAKRGVYQAHNYFGHGRRLYSWAQGIGYAVPRSPFDNLKVNDVVGGKRKSRKRTLKDWELRLVWQAAELTPYPHGEAVKFLILTGQRKQEPIDASWPEFDLDGVSHDGLPLWSISAERMKMDEPHEVLLAPMALKLMRELPRGGRGEFLFSADAGEHAISGFSDKAKKRFDALVAKLRAAQRLGKEPKDVKPEDVEEGDKLEPWVIHDLRRTMRSHLSALPIEEKVRELIIAHQKKKLDQSYDQFEYREAKAAAMREWEKKLRKILQPPAPATVTDLDTEREARA